MEARQRRQIYFGWKVVAASFLISSVSMGALYCWGVFFLPMIQEFGWSRTIFSGVSLVGGLTYAVFVPMAGWLADRVGYRRVTAITAGIFGLGFVLSSQIQTYWQFYIFVGFFAGLGAPVSLALPLSMVSRWFHRRQGLALGLASSGIGAGAALLPPLISFLIAGFGWRLTWIFLGLVVWLVCIPAALLTMGPPNPDDVRIHENANPTETVTAPIRGENHEYSLQEALATPPFWSLFAIFALCIFGLSQTLTHLVPHAQDTGLSPVTAAVLLSCLGISSIMGRLVSGFLSDRIGAGLVFCGGLALQGLMMLWLTQIRAAWAFFLFAVFFGLAYGGNVVLIPKLAARIFGLKSMGAIFGGLSVADGLGFATGALLAGYIFDVTGSYHASFLMVAGGMLIAVILALTLKENPRPKRTDPVGQP